MNCMRCSWVGNRTSRKVLDFNCYNNNDEGIMVIIIQICYKEIDLRTWITISNERIIRIIFSEQWFSFLYHSIYRQCLNTKSSHKS